MALWDCYLTPSDWRRPEIGWLHGPEKKRAEDLVKPLWEARESMWLDQKYLYCHVIAVRPESQRKGVGEVLFKFGINLAQQARLPIYIESSKEAIKLYQKMGCKRVKDRKSQKSKDVTPDADRAIDLFVWLPENNVQCLPQTVVLE